MKKLLIILLIGLSGCTSHTSYGDCIGAFDDKNPSLVYKLNVWNLVVGVFFVGMVVPPIVVIADETLCPVGFK